MYTVVSDYGIFKEETLYEAVVVAEDLHENYCCDVYILEGNRRVMGLIYD